MNISGPFIRRPIGTSLLAIGLFVLGMICYFLLGVAALPNLEFPAIFVTASQPGGSADVMSSTVAAPLERHLGQIPGIDSISSSSSENSASVFLSFDGKRTVDDYARDVQAAINAAAPDLPSGLTNAPTYRKMNPNNQPVLILALTSDTVPLSKLYDYADSLLAQRIRQLPGVSDVEVAGGATPAVRVDLNLRALSSMGLSPDQLRNALIAANVTSPQGFLSDGKTTTAVVANDALRTAAEFADVVISAKNGVPVRLKDVARVYDGQQDQYQAAWFGTRRAILLFVRKQADANVIATVDSVKADIPLMQTWLPAGVELDAFFDRTPIIRASVDEVQVTLLISLGMVILTMALFLRRLAPTLIAATAVPLSVAGAFIVMYLLGYTLDNMSLMALVIAIGFVVDDAIVVIENVIRHVDAGMPRLEATLLGAKEIGFTIVSITASLVAVFVPVVFAGGITGMFFKEFTVTLIAAIVFSAIVSLTLTPALCGRFLKPHAEATPSRFGRRLDAFHAGMQDLYRRALDHALHWPRLTALQPLLLIVITIFLMRFVQGGLFPQQDTGMLFGRTTAGSDVSPSRMMEQQQKIAALVMKDPAVASVGSRLGGGWGGGGGGSGQLYISLKPLAERGGESTFLVMTRLNKMAGEVPGVRLRLRPVQDLPSGGGGGGGGTGGQYQVQLKGNDIVSLQEWTPKLVEALKKLPQLRDVGSDVDEAGPRQLLRIDRDTAARLGVSVGAIDSALYDAFGQRQVSTIYSDINQFKVVVSALPNQATDPASLERIYVRASGGNMVPITAVTKMVDTVAPTEIEHEDQFSTISLSFNLAPDATMSQAQKLIQDTIAGLRLPGDIRMDFAGDFRNFQKQQGDNSILIFGAIIAVYIVLGMLYESLIHPVTILSTLPSAGVGALLAMVVTGTELSVISMIAIVLLIGIVKKNAIMMVDFALVAERERGLSPFEAIREASLVRFRPIMMTSMVAICAALPLAIGFGVGSELRRPLGIAMIGGLIVSQSLTLLSTPAIYLLFARLSERRRKRKEEKKLRSAAIGARG
ncbi:efflux RND transporter permease subunit [Dokdonella sp.]|uniref:efflux RND transporter permease subunit n=1 Tax=Dokdonella sp. TaxID=2291710 RepID=UPI001B174B3F|nr:efflux RND transporter permease subunit [Dokdonella sp.]MBO9661461.1 efflux RND transporter permease subunit [Dokdonella sp.]